MRLNYRAARLAYSVKILPGRAGFDVAAVIFQPFFIHAEHQKIAAGVVCNRIYRMRNGVFEAEKYVKSFFIAFVFNRPVSVAEFFKPVLPLFFRSGCRRVAAEKMIGGKYSRIILR